MEATALSVGKSVLDGALGYAKSAVAEEVALQLGVQRDHAFIRDELAMMQAFLRAVHGERDDQEVLMTWVKQVRDVAYDAEDCLQDFSIHLHKPSWWRLPRTLRERRRIAKQMKELRARVEDVSQRNLRYQLIKSTATSAEQPSIRATAIFSIDGARQAAKRDNSKVELVHLINMEGEDVRVISLWGTSGDLGLASIINEAYEDPYIKKKFSCQAWVRVLHPFNPNDFIQSLVKQFRSAMGVDIMLEKEKTRQELVEEFTVYINKSYLIVLNGLSTFEEWNGIRPCFPNNQNGSRIIVCTPQAEFASLCAGQESQVFKLKKLSADQTVYAFCEKDQAKLLMQMSSSNAATTSTEILGNQHNSGDESKVVTRSFTRLKTMACALEESQLIGREKEKSEVVKLICKQTTSQKLPVVSVWGMGGLGKTTLVKDVYESQNLIGIFEKRACVTVMRPFVLKEFLKSLIIQLTVQSSTEKNGAIDFGHSTRNIVGMMGVEGLITELARLLEGKKCLIVLDDVSSRAEWDHIIGSFPKLDNTCRIVVTTREESIAKYCSEKQENIYKLKVLEYQDALHLFTRKVFKEAKDLDKHPDLIEEAKPILKKCNGLPLAIVTIGGFLANQPKTVVEWRKLNEHISAELKMNPDLEAIRTILGKSYDGLPYHLKSCFLYLSIFPEDHKVRRRLLMRRWAAEGFSREIHEKTAEEIADSYFMQLIGRSMILPSKTSSTNREEIDSCHVHDLMREIAILKSTEENLVFRLEEGCSSKAQGKVRHLTVSSNWNGDKSEFESAMDLSHIRSLTVFGDWKQFFISEKMRLLRVLDLEGTRGLLDHHLEPIGSLFHLKYISLRGCRSIYHLPDSLGNLQLLQTLDMKGTCICKLPRTIVKLTKLQYLFAGDDIPSCVFFDQRLPNDMTKLCMACCAPKFLKGVDDYMDGDPNRHDVCSLWCHVVFPTLASRRPDPYGVVVPRRIRNLKDLRTLGFVNIRNGKAILQDIRCLTQLRNLAVGGINQNNCEQFSSTLATLSHLESLSAQSSGELGLHGCLDGVSSAPKNLQSLKLDGTLIKLPEWIAGLQSLIKLMLRNTRLKEVDATMEVLGKLPKLAILQLGWDTFSCEESRLTFYGEAFPSLMVLELFWVRGLRSVEFKDGTTPKLALLHFGGTNNCGLFSGLASLQNLKEFMLKNFDYEEEFLNDIQDQLARNQNLPVLKRR